MGDSFKIIQNNHFVHISNHRFAYTNTHFEHSTFEFPQILFLLEDTIARLVIRLDYESVFLIENNSFDKDMLSKILTYGILKSVRFWGKTCNENPITVDFCNQIEKFESCVLDLSTISLLSFF